MENLLFLGVPILKRITVDIPLNFRVSLPCPFLVEIGFGYSVPVYLELPPFQYNFKVEQRHC